MDKLLFIKILSYMCKLKDKYIHDFRNIRSTRAVYGVGLVTTGSLAVEALIRARTAPEIVLFFLQFYTKKKI